MRASSSPIDPAFDIAPITPGSGDLVDPADGAAYVARAILCEKAGIATVQMLSGNVRVGVPLTIGWNPIYVKQLTIFNTQDANYPTMDSSTTKMDSSSVTFDKNYSNDSIWGVKG